MTNGYYNNGGNGNGNGNFNNGNDGAVADGNGRGINIVTMMDCRIAGFPDYLPAHIKQGAQKPTQAQANFTVYQNIGNKKFAFPITAWGKMADVVARGGATGKQLQLICTVHSYRGRVWLPTPDGAQPQFVLRPDGQPLLIEKIGFTVESILFGKDSEKTIQAEINANFRPRGWNDPAQPGYQQWREICRRNNNLQFAQNMTWFGYAKVKPVNGTIYIEQNQNNGGGWQQQNQQTGNATQYQHNSGAVGGGFNQNQNNNGGWQQQNQNNGGNQQGGQPEYINGQYVGNRMNNQQNGQYNNNGNGYNPNHQFQPNQANQNNGAGVVM